MFLKSKKTVGMDQDMRESLSKLNILDTPLEERFERITRLVCLTLGVPISAFSIIDRERQWFKSIQGLSSSQTPIEQSFCAHTILGDDIMVIEDAKEDRRFSSNPLVKGNPNIAFYAGYPVRAPDGRNIGALCAIDSKSRNITPEQVNALRDLAHILESELKVAHLSKAQYDLINELDNAQRIAVVDPLTRLWNLTGIQDILKREWSAGTRKNLPLTVVMADIDGFEAITGKHGDAGGDKVLTEMAKRLLAVLRGEDAVAHIGREKFMLILPESKPDEVFQALERIREAITLKPVSTASGEVNVTMSFGATTEIPKISFEFSDLVKAAETALVKARANGGDRTEISDFA